MSLTGTDGLFAGVHENGINDFINAYFGARPRFLKIGTPLFVSATTVDQTRIDPIDLGGGIHFMLELTPPKLDLHPSTNGFALAPGPNEFSLEIKAKLTVACIKQQRDKPDDRKDFPTESTDLAVCARGSIVRNGNLLKLVIDEVEIKDIQPDSLESVIECILLQVLQGALAGLCIPYSQVNLQIGTLTPGPAPVIADNTLSVSANLV